MKPFLIYFIFSINIILGQTDSTNNIIKLNDPNAPDKSQISDVTFYSNPMDRNKPTLLKVNYSDHDTIVELVYDPNYTGTATELEEGMNNGSLMRYIVFDNDGKYHERVKVVEIEESFFEEYWVEIVIAIIISILIYYKLNIPKTPIDSEIENDKQITEE